MTKEEVIKVLERVLAKHYDNWNVDDVTIVHICIHLLNWKYIDKAKPKS